MKKLIELLKQLRQSISDFYCSEDGDPNCGFLGYG